MSLMSDLGTAVKSKLDLKQDNIIAGSNITIDVDGKTVNAVVPVSVSELTNDSGYQTSTQVNSAIQAVVGAAPAALDTLKEIADQLADDEDAVSALTTVVSNKVDKVAGKGLSTEDYSTAEKTKLSGIAVGSEVNQNAFSNVVVGATTLAADTKMDTLTLVAGTNVTITPDAATDTITISANDTSVAFTEITAKPTTLSGYGITDAAASSHVGATGTAHGAATTAVAGFMSSTDKTKLDGIASGAQVNTVDSVAGKTGVVTLVKADVGLANVDNTADTAKPVSTAQQTALNLKANLASPTFTGTVSGITKAMVGLGNVDNTSDASKPVSTATQTALDLKADSTTVTSHTSNTSNPHSVTKAQVGLGSVDNTSDTTKSVLSASKLTTARTIGGVSFDGTANINLPGVNAAGSQSTTGNAATATKLATARTINGVSFDGTANITVADSTKVVANSNITAGTATKVTYDAKGLITSGTTLAASDIPSLDASKITSGVIDAARLPSYVDDVIEGTNLAAFPATGETGKIYVALDTNKTYRWSGTAYVYITSGAVDSVAGKTGVVALVKADVGLGNVDNTADASKAVLTATKLATARTLSLTGDVTGSVSFDGSANAAITATIAANSVALGTDTTGNYVAGATAGTGISVTGTAGEGWSPTITNTSPNVTTNITTTHNASTVVVNSSDGTSGTINEATTSLAGVMSSTDKTKLNGIAAGAQVNVATNLSATAGTTINSSTGTNVVIPSASATASGIITTGTQTIAGTKTFSSTITGSVSGNAATATKLASIGTTFSNTYPLTINASGVIYSNGNITYDGTNNRLSSPKVNATTELELGNTQQASILYNSVSNSIDFIIN